MTPSEPIPVEVTIKFTTNDFDSLWTTSMNWKDTDWAAQDGRFTPMPDYNKWQRAYWFDLGMHFIMAKSYLEAVGAEYTHHIDSFDNDDTWVILTNFGGTL